MKLGSGRWRKGRIIRLYCGIGGGRKEKKRAGKKRRGTGKSEFCVNPFFRMVVVGKGGFFLPRILSTLRTVLGKTWLSRVG